MRLTGYLRIPDVPGESRDEGHEDEIAVADVVWGVRQRPSTGGGSGRRRGRADVEPVVCTKEYDASSPYLALAAVRGRSFPDAVLTLRRGGGLGALDYLTVELRHVSVSSYDVLGTDPAAGGAVLWEAVGLSFEEARIRYVEQTPDGSPGDAHEVEFDLSAGT